MAAFALFVGTTVEQWSLRVEQSCQTMFDADAGRMFTASSLDGSGTVRNGDDAYVVFFSSPLTFQTLQSGLSLLFFFMLLSSLRHRSVALDERAPK